MPALTTSLEVRLRRWVTSPSAEIIVAGVSALYLLESTGVGLDFQITDEGGSGIVDCHRVRRHGRRWWKPAWREVYQMDLPSGNSMSITRNGLLGPLGDRLVIDDASYMLPNAFMPEMKPLEMSFGRVSLLLGNTVRGYFAETTPREMALAVSGFLFMRKWREEG